MAKKNLTYLVHGLINSVIRTILDYLLTEIPLCDECKEALEKLASTAAD